MESSSRPQRDPDIVLLAVLVLAFILWRRGAPVLAIAALVVGIPLWFGWEYARPTWTTGVVTGTQVRRSDPDARGNTTDIQYIYMRKRSSDRGFESVNEDNGWTRAICENSNGLALSPRASDATRTRCLATRISRNGSPTSSTVPWTLRAISRTSALDSRSPTTKATVQDFIIAT